MPRTFETDPWALPRHRYAGALDGPEHEVSYPKGHRTGFVTAIYKARIISGSPASGNGELSEPAWFKLEELPGCS